MAEISVVGITDAGPGSLLPEARHLVEVADLLCGGERHLAFFPHHTAEQFVIKSNIPELVQRLRGETRPAVVLASGDPCWYGIGPLLAERLGRDRVRILPNVSSAQLAFARLGLASQDAVMLSAHGRPLERILPVALTAQKVVILTDERNTPSTIARALLNAGSEDAHADVFEHIGGPRERHVSGRLSEIATQEFAALNLLVVRREEVPRPWPLGLPEEAFAHSRGLITKAEVRAVSLAKLRLHERATLWDIGAGCGSVAIEAGALVGHGKVFAVERDPQQLGYLEENKRHFGAGNVQIVPGEAPGALRDLATPDAVFIGGSGGQLEGILKTAMERVRAGGVVAANIATLNHLTEAMSLAQTQGWDIKVTQVAVSRSSPIAGMTRLAALNPVWILSVQHKWEVAE